MYVNLDAAYGEIGEMFKPKKGFCKPYSYMLGSILHLEKNLWNDQAEQG